MNVDLQEWANENQPKNTLLYGNGYWDQIIFIRDKIFGLMYMRKLVSDEDSVKVISTHTSKSVTLPVYQLTLANGIVITMRYNFHNWKVSISSPKYIELNVMNLFGIGDENHPVYFEGFPEDLIYGAYYYNKKNFSFELSDDYKLYTFMWIFKETIK